MAELGFGKTLQLVRSTFRYVLDELSPVLGVPNLRWNPSDGMQLSCSIRLELNSHTATRSTLERLYTVLGLTLQLIHTCGATIKSRMYKSKEERKHWDMWIRGGSALHIGVYGVTVLGMSLWFCSR